jgi:hypothetical protein
MVDAVAQRTGAVGAGERELLRLPGLAGVLDELLDARLVLVDELVDGLLGEAGLGVLPLRLAAWEVPPPAAARP